MDIERLHVEARRRGLVLSRGPTWAIMYPEGYPHPTRMAEDSHRRYHPSSIRDPRSVEIRPALCEGRPYTHVTVYGDGVAGDMLYPRETAHSPADELRLHYVIARALSEGGIVCIYDLVHAYFQSQNSS